LVEVGMANPVSEALVAGFKCGEFGEHGGYWRPLDGKDGSKEGNADLAVVGNGMNRRETHLIWGLKGEKGPGTVFRQKSGTTSKDMLAERS
jgi:hypothetical protein